jgi:5'-3' exonuclease
VSPTAVLGEYGTLNKVYEGLEGIPKLPIRGARHVSRSLAEHRERAFLMRTLTTIVCGVPVDLDIDGAMIEESNILPVPSHPRCPLTVLPLKASSCGVGYD